MLDYQSDKNKSTDSRCCCPVHGENNLFEMFSQIYSAKKKVVFIKIGDEDSNFRKITQNFIRENQIVTQLNQSY